MRNKIFNATDMETINSAITRMINGLTTGTGLHPMSCLEKL
jgi:hypothetical protein